MIRDPNQVKNLVFDLMKDNLFTGDPASRQRNQDTAEKNFTDFATGGNDPMLVNMGYTMLLQSYSALKQEALSEDLGEKVAPLVQSCTAFLGKVMQDLLDNDNAWMAPDMREMYTDSLAPEAVPA